MCYFLIFSVFWWRILGVNEGFSFFWKLKSHCLEHIKTLIFQNFQLFEKKTDLFDWFERNHTAYAFFKNVKILDFMKFWVRSWKFWRFQIWSQMGKLCLGVQISFQMDNDSLKYLRETNRITKISDKIADFRRFLPKASAVPRENSRKLRICRKSLEIYMISQNRVFRHVSDQFLKRNT